MISFRYVLHTKRNLFGHWLVANETDKPPLVMVSKADNGKTLAAHDFGDVQEEQLYLIHIAGNMFGYRDSNAQTFFGWKTNAKTRPTTNA
jgi:hypothetical protein